MNWIAALRFHTAPLLPTTAHHYTLTTRLLLGLRGNIKVFKANFKVAYDSPS